MCRVAASHVGCSYLALGDDIVYSLGDSVGVVIETKVSQHHASRQNQSGWVGLVLALDIKTDVTATWLENSDVATHVATWNNAWTTDETSTNVGQNASVQVWHDQDIELLWARDTLHRGVVDNHVVCLDGWVLLADLADSVAEKAVGQLHNVGLVDAGDLAAVVGQGKGESKLGNALRLGTCDDLERLDDAADGLVLETRVLSLGVFTDNA